MIRDLVKSNDSILHRKILPCGCNCDRHFVAKTLIENMLHYEGVGLSANQIGMDTRVFAMIRDIEYNDVIVGSKDEYTSLLVNKEEEEGEKYKI